MLFCLWWLIFLFSNHLIWFIFLFFLYLGTVFVLIIKNLSVKYLWSKQQTFGTWSLIMKQITSEKDKINISLICDLQGFFEGVEGIWTYNRIFFFITHMIICSNQYFKDVIFRLFSKWTISFNFLVKIHIFNFPAKKYILFYINNQTYKRILILN